MSRDAIQMDRTETSQSQRFENNVVFGFVDGKTAVRFIDQDHIPVHFYVATLAIA